MRVPRFRLGRVPGANAQRALAAGAWSTGRDLVELEDALRERFGIRHVVLAANCFSATWLTLRHLAPPGRVAVAAGSTCLSMLHAVRAAGHSARLVDVDPWTGSLSLAAPTSDDVVLRVAHFGILDRSPAFVPGPPVVEDAAQSVFSALESPMQVHARVLSFYPTKWLGGIDGGALLTNDEQLADEVRRSSSYASQRIDDGQARWNVRMHNLSAALVLDALGEVNDIRRRCREVAETYVAKALEIGLRVVGDHEPRNALQRVLVRLESRADRDALAKRMRVQGVEVFEEWLHLGPDDANAFPGSITLRDCTLSLPLFPDIKPDEVTHVVSCLARAWMPSRSRP